MIVPLCALGLLVWTIRVRVQRVEYVTNLAKDELRVNAGSPTGYAGNMRRLIVPEHNSDSYNWIVQTQLMLAQREWRVRHIDYENAPFGHEVTGASPYRWWLGLIAWLEHEVSGRPLGRSVEQAALLAGPLLHLLLFVGATIFGARRFGALPSALLSIGLVVIFPLAGEFLPGLPDDHGLALACGLWSVLLLLAGVQAGSPVVPPAGGGPEEIGLAHASRRTWCWFFAAGVMGGVGLWIGVASQVPIIVGIALGGMMAAWIARGGVSGAAPWRAWALGGGATSLAAYLIEYFPSHMGSWQLRVNHPLYGLAWLGGGEVLLQMTTWIRWGRRAWNLRAAGMAVLGVAALAATPVVMWKTHNQGFLAADLFSSKLTRLPDGAEAANFWAWLIHAGITPTVWAVVLPVFLVLPAGWFVVRRRTEMASRVSLALALGPILVALGFACWQLRWWNGVDGMLLALLIAATVAIRGAINPRFTRWVWSGFVAALLAPGAYKLLSPLGVGADKALTELEANGLIERDLAHWLAKQVGPEGALVLAPPNETSALNYYGGLRGLATLDWENRDGLVAAVRIASATTAEEALELINRRGVTHIIIPSWDSYLDEYARLGLGQLEGSFISRLHQWGLPPWLQAVSYQLPTMKGLEGQSVTVLAVVDEQDDAVAFSRRAEYFVEMGQLDHAAAASQTLRRFPGDPGALVALLDVELAVGDSAGFTQTFESLLARLSSKADRALPWDRRVSLAVILARGRKMDLAREQVQLCLAAVDAAKLRSLSTGSLYRLQVLTKAFGLVVADQQLRELAADLLPADLRNGL